MRNSMVENIREWPYHNRVLNSSRSRDFLKIQIHVQTGTTEVINTDHIFVNNTTTTVFRISEFWLGFTKVSKPLFFYLQKLIVVQQK